MTQSQPEQGPPSEALIQYGDSVAMPLPKALTERYNLAPGVQVELYPTEAGIFLRPVGVAAWFSMEWEHAMEAVLSVHKDALKALGEAQDKPPSTSSGQAQ